MFTAARRRIEYTHLGPCDSRQQESLSRHHLHCGAHTDILSNGKTDEEHRIWHGNNIIDIDCGCGNLRSEHRRLACLRLDDMADFYVGNSAEQTTAGSPEILPYYEQDLPASLLHAREEYKRGLRENVSFLDCLWGELYGSINACQWDRSITEQEAEYLREKYP